MFIENLSDAKKMWSIWATAGLAAVNALLVAIPAAQPYLSPALFAGINIGGAVVIAFLRVLNQNLGTQDEKSSS
jgi:hypothetical protein